MIPDPHQAGSDELQSHLEGEGLNVRDVHGAILREKDDPRDGYEPIPLWLVSAFMALVFWAGAYLSFYSGGFQADVFDPVQVSWAGGGAAVKGPPDPMVVANVSSPRIAWLATNRPVWAWPGSFRRWPGASGC